jgi:hypothetical protein
MLFNPCLKLEVFLGKALALSVLITTCVLRQEREQCGNGVLSGPQSERGGRGDLHIRQLSSRGQKGRPMVGEGGGMVLIYRTICHDLKKNMR